MRHFTHFLPLASLFSFLLLAGCQAQAQSHMLSDDEAIDAVYERFSEAYHQMEPEMVIALYTDEAYYLPGNGAILHGPDDLRQTFAFLAQTKENGGQLAISFRSVDRAIEDNMAYDVGYYKLTSKSADGAEGVSVGKFTTVLIKGEDNQWRFQVDSFSNAPADAFDAATE